VLEKLFGLYPQLFGARFLPLKLGVFQELLAKHPEQFEKESLKAALGIHTRSTRYLQCVAAGNQRHDLAGEPVDALAPEHVLAALLELHRRRQARTPEDLAPKLRAQIIKAFEASGLSKHDYLIRVQTKDEATNDLLAQAFEHLSAQRARQAALLQALDASGASPEDFANSYGVALHDVRAAIAQRPALAKS
jgi:sRNA-binding protein